MNQDANYERNRKIILVLSVSIVIIAFLGAIILLTNKNRKKVSSGEYVDPLSHQTISDPSNKSPETNGEKNIQPIYLGFSELVDQGLSADQLSGLKTAFYRYSMQQSSPLKEISIDVDHINISKPTSGETYTMQFKVRFDRKNDYNAKVEYSGLSSVKLQLLTTENQNIYDSGIIDAEGSENE